jgi:hypothetical protein
MWYGLPLRRVDARCRGFVRAVPTLGYCAPIVDWRHGLPSCLERFIGRAAFGLGARTTRMRADDASTLSRRQKILAANIPHRGTQGPLPLLIDIESVSATGSSEPARGIKREGEGEWNARKHGGAKRRVWRKVHLGSTRKHWRFGRSRSPAVMWAMPRCCPSCSARSLTISRPPASPSTALRTRASATTPPPNGVPTPSCRRARTRSLGRRSQQAPSASRYLGRALWRRWSGYHRRSRVETKMHCGKLLDQRLMAGDFDRQVTELQVRVAVLNGFTALGIPGTKVAG